MGFFESYEERQERVEAEAEAERLEDAYKLGQEHGSEDESRSFFYSRTWTDEAEADSYRKGHDNGQDNQPK